MHIRKCIWGISYGLILTVFTGYVLLDTFVLKQVYSVAPSEDSRVAGTDMDTQEKTAHTSDSESDIPVITDRSYEDKHISIAIVEYREYDSAVYVADIRISSAEYLQTAFAEGAYGKNITEKTSAIAQRNSAILAINGDYYGTREKGYVLRDGIVYRSVSVGNQEDLVIYADGSFAIITEDEVSMGELHYLFVVSDGRTEESEGLSLYELAHFMQSIGAVTAYNLDGGGSSTMYFNGQVINQPTTGGNRIKERSVSDIVYIGY